MIKKSEEGEDVLSFLLMKYDRRHKSGNGFHLPNFSTVSILGAGSGGADNLKNMLSAYKGEYRRFRAPPGGHPVVFIVDNDGAGRKLFALAKEISEPKISSISGSEAFIFVFGNVYLVPIPKHESKPETSIEDLFFDEDIPKYIGGKELQLSNENSAAQAGKSDFAFEYVDKNAEKINWSRFEILLGNICRVFNDYQRRLGS